MIGEALKGHLDLLLLSVLQDGPAHGYAIIEQLKARSGGTFDLPEGTIYPALHRLEEDGLLRSFWSDESGRRRRVYELRRKGLESRDQRRQDGRAFDRAIDSTLRVGFDPMQEAA